jgi:hypothetical protein
MQPAQEAFCIRTPKKFLSLSLSLTGPTLCGSRRFLTIIRMAEFLYRRNKTQLMERLLGFMCALYRSSTHSHGINTSSTWLPGEVLFDTQYK